MAILELAKKLTDIFGKAGSFSVQVDGMEIIRRGEKFLVNDVATGKSKPLAEMTFQEQAELEAFLETMDHLGPLPVHSPPTPDPEDIFSEAAGEDADIKQSEAYKELSL